MTKLRIAKNVAELQAALADVDDPEITFEDVYQGEAEGVVVLHFRNGDGELTIISVRASDFQEPERQPIIHAHDDQPDWHEHSYPDYVDHPPYDGELFPQF